MAEYIEVATAISRLCVAPMPEADIFEKEYFPDGFQRPKVTIQGLEHVRDELYAQDLITTEGLERLNALIGECATEHDGGDDNESD